MKHVLGDIMTTSRSPLIVYFNRYHTYPKMTSRIKTKSLFLSLREKKSCETCGSETIF